MKYFQFCVTKISYFMNQYYNRLIPGIFSRLSQELFLNHLFTEKSPSNVDLYSTPALYIFDDDSNLGIFLSGNK